MANWVDVNAAKLPRSRRMQGILSLLIACLTAWDFAACSLCGAAALEWFGPVSRDLSLLGLFPHDIVLGSLIAALALRGRGLHDSRVFVAISERLWDAVWRCLLAFSLLMALVAATQSSKEWAQPWLIAWVGWFLMTVLATRAALGCYCRFLQHRGALREAVAIVGARGPRERLAARLAGEAEVVAVYGAQTGTCQRL